MDLEICHDSGVEWGITDQIGRIVLSRPEAANSIGLAQSKALPKAFDAIVEAAPRVIVLSARGSIFCGGGDIRSMVAAADALAPYIESTLEPLLSGFARLATAPCPIVAVVNGPIGGAGIGLALVADFVLASPAMKLRAGYPAIGLSPDVGASYFLARRVGAIKAQRWLMTNALITAEECLAAGAVDELHPADELDGRAEALVMQLRQAAPASMQAIKQLCTQAGRLDAVAHIALEGQLLSACAATADAVEGVRAFIEKRAAVFSGKGGDWRHPLCGPRGLP